MTNSTAILDHLQASELIEVREWARVLWVKAVVAGRTVCRFVSKKIGATMTEEFNFMNRPMSQGTLDQTKHYNTVILADGKYRITYYSNEGSNRAWSKLKNEVKCQSRWNGTEWVSAKSYQEFCSAWRLPCCRIEKI